MAFVERRLRARITRAKRRDGTQPTFDGTGFDTVELSGFRMSATLQHAGGWSDGTMNLTIWGLKRSTTNELATFGVKYNLVPQAPITLEAGDPSGFSTVFVGNILSGYADYSDAPEVAFHLLAHCVLPQAVEAIPASSFRGSVDVATIMAGLATQMGLKFENSGVNVKLRNPYFSGSAKTQMQACAQHAGINANVINGVLAIWPKFGSRGGQVPLVSPKTGMIGYPIFHELGIRVRTLYNPSIGLGQKIKVESNLTPANGEYSVYNLEHELECMVPKGRWFSTVDGYAPKVPQVK